MRKSPSRIYYKLYYEKYLSSHIYQHVMYFYKRCNIFV